jgi:hypothetical protein
VRTSSNCTAAERQRVRSELRHVGSHFHPGQAPRIVQHERATIVELEAGANPVGTKGMRSVEESFYTRVAVEQEYARHAEAKPELHAISLEQHQLASAISAGDGQSFDRSSPRARRRQLLCRVGVGPAPPDSCAHDPFRQSAIRLHFQDLGHGARERTGLPAPRRLPQ